MRPLYLAALLTLDASARIIPVLDWSLNYGYCRAHSAMTRRQMLEPITAHVGDTIDIRYAAEGDMAGHDVLQFPDESSCEI